MSDEALTDPEQNLQGLLDRIQKDGVEKAEAEAADIVAAARRQAAELEKEAETKAGRLVQKAEADAAVFEARSRKALEQAARDLIITVGQAVTALFEQIVAQAVGDSLSPELVNQMLVKVVEAYAGAGENERRVELLVSPEAEKPITDFMMNRFRKAVEQGLLVRSDNQVVAGFKVSLVDQNLYHDFSREAIADSLCRLLRPHLAEIVRNAVGTPAQTE